MLACCPSKVTREILLAHSKLLIFQGGTVIPACCSNVMNHCYGFEESRRDVFYQLSLLLPFHSTSHSPHYFLLLLAVYAFLKSYDDCRGVFGPELKKIGAIFGATFPNLAVSK